MFKKGDPASPGAGRPKSRIDLEQAAALAEEGLPLNAIGGNLVPAVSRRTMNRRFDEDEGLRDVIQEGWAKAARKLNDELKKNKHIVSPVFRAKQAHLLGFVDERSEVRHSGQIEHVLRPVDIAWDRRSKILQAERKLELENPAVDLEQTDDGKWAVEPKSDTEN